MQIDRRNVLLSLTAFALPFARQAGAATNTSPFPHAPPQLPLLPQRKRLTLSHWHFFPVSFDNKPVLYDYYTRELLPPTGEGGKHAAYGGFLRDRPIPMSVIPLREWQIAAAAMDIAFAEAAGVDAFQFNIPTFDPRHGYVRNIGFLLSAIEQKQLDFRIVPNLECASMPSTLPVSDVVAGLKPLLQHPGSLKMADGRPMLSCFAYDAWSAERWTEVLRALEVAGVPVYFAPMLLDPAKGTPEHLRLADMIGWWAGNHPDGVRDVRRAAEAARSIGKAVLYPVWTQDYRAKNAIFAEARNTEVFRSGWEQAIGMDPECVNVLTWNDYSESSALRPSVGTQYLFADMNRYYSDWFRSGQQPSIVRDVLYYCHRRDFTDAGHAAVPDRAATRLVLGRTPANDVEAIAFATAASTLEIRNGLGTTRQDIQAGIRALRAPLAPGQQHFRLQRGGKDLLTVDSPFEVRDRWEWQDLVYRGGSSSRAPVAGVAEFSARTPK